MISGIIFDLDGTLLDSLCFWQTVPEKYLNSIGIKAQKDLFRQLESFSLKESALFFIKNYKMNLSVNQILDGINQIIEKFYKEEVQLKNGVNDFMALLRKKKIKTALATSTPAYLAEAALKRLGLSDFVCIESCNDCNKGKDGSEEVYEKALEKLNLPKRDVWVFEDSLFAVKTAKTAGFRVCAVADKYQSDVAEIKAAADCYVNSMKDFDLTRCEI